MLATFYLLVISHFIADFIFQGPLAIKKKGLNRYMLLHGGIMALAFFLPLINYPSGKVLLGTLILFVAHMLIDAIRTETTKLFKVMPGTYPSAVSLGIDQILHISVIYSLFNFFIIQEPIA